MIRASYNSKCTDSCGLQILRDRILPDMKELENFEKNHGYWMGTGDSHCSSYDYLNNNTMAVVDEVQKQCASMTGIDIKCSFEPTSKLSLKAMTRMVTTMEVYALDVSVPCS